MKALTAKKATKNRAKIKYIIFFIFNNLHCEIVKNMTIDLINLKTHKKILK